MKRTLLFLAIAAVTAAAAAPPSSGSDVIGLYTTTTAISNRRMPMPAAGARLTMYLLAVDISDPNGLSGYECGVDVQLLGGQTLTEPPSVTLPDSWMNALSWPNLRCTGGPLNQVLPQASVIQLAKIVIVNKVGEDPDTGDVLPIQGPLIGILGPCNPCSFGPGTLWPQFPIGPGYADGQDPGVLHRLMPSGNIPASSRPYFYEVFCGGWECLEGDFPESGQAGSWTDVKSLYR